MMDDEPDSDAATCYSHFMQFRDCEMGGGGSTVDEVGTDVH